MTTRTRLDVPGISCEHCQRAVTEALTPIPGVIRVDVNIPSKQVLVEYDQSAVSLDRLKDVLAEEDYPVTAATPA